MRSFSWLVTGLVYLSTGCKNYEKNASQLDFPFIAVLGIAQDAGYPQVGCTRECCAKAWTDPSLRKFVTSLALVDPLNKKWWLLEATPDIKEQLHLFRGLTGSAYNFLPDGIFLTHGHIGHYTGLMQLGRESINATNIRVHVMPRMKKFLTENGPWSQLVSLNNISLNDIESGSSIALSDNISIKPFIVPHRDEYTETVGLSINTNDHQTLFIPDIDKWNKFEKDVTSLVKGSDLALLDGTFYKEGELVGRSMSEVPHPIIEETVQLFSALPAAEKKKIRFIHYNHTNPLLDEHSAESKRLNSLGFMVTKQGELILLK